MNTLYQNLSYLTYTPKQSLYLNFKSIPRNQSQYLNTKSMNIFMLQR